LPRCPLALGSCSSEAQFGFFQFGHAITFMSVAAVTRSRNAMHLVPRSAALISVLICCYRPTRPAVFPTLDEIPRKIHKSKVPSFSPNTCVRGYVGAIGRHARRAKRDETLTDGAGLLARRAVGLLGHAGPGSLFEAPALCERQQSKNRPRGALSGIPCKNPTPAAAALFQRAASCQRPDRRPPATSLESSGAI
jgi:hypothetical protein